MLGLDPAAGQDTATALLCLLDARLPEDRLADPRLAGEDECGRASFDLGDESSDRAELLFAPYDGGRHVAATRSRLVASSALRTPSLR